MSANAITVKRVLKDHPHLAATKAGRAKARRVVETARKQMAVLKKRTDAEIKRAIDPKAPPMTGTRGKRLVLPKMTEPDFRRLTDSIKAHIARVAVQLEKDVTDELRRAIYKYEWVNDYAARHQRFLALAARHGVE